MRVSRRAIALVAVLAACSRAKQDAPAPPAPALVRAAEPIPEQYLVVLRPGAAGVAALAAELAGAHDGQVLRTYERALRGFAARMGEADALALSTDPRVAYVAEDGRARARALEVQLGAPAALDRIDQRGATLDGLYLYPDGAGEGVHVYVLDTGIRATHAEVAGRATEEQDFVGDGRSGDCNGHGTHVAAIAAGTTYGVAKKAKLHALRVLGCDGTGATSAVLAALDWLVANAERPAVANLSLGRDPDATLDAAVEAAVSAGVPVVVAAGDAGQDACGGSPARAPGAMTVAAAELSGKAAARSTNQGPCVDFFAPGVNVRSAWPFDLDGAHPPATVGSDGATTIQSGTSAAAPLVAGAAALYLGRFPDATPDAVARALVANSTRLPQGLARYTPDRFLFTTFVDDDNSADVEPPAVGIHAPLAGATVSGADVAVGATATDDQGVTRVELFANGRFVQSDGEAPFELAWDSRREPAGPATLVVRAYDRAGNAADSAPVSVDVQNPGAAVFDEALAVPRCETPAPACDSLDLLRGRAGLGPEAHAPNTLRVPCPTATDPAAACACPDGPLGGYGVDESIEQVVVATLSGGDLAVGSDVQVDVVAYVGSTAYDRVDLYSSSTVAPPAWRYVGSAAPAASGLQTLAVRFTLPEGGVQAVRAVLRYGGLPMTCSDGGFDERDDLVFAVAPGTPDTQPPAVVVTAPVAAAKVEGVVTVAADATDDHLVDHVEFTVGDRLVGSDAAPPYAIAWNTGAFPNGPYEVRAIAFDGAGHSTTSAPVPITVKDETPPSVAITSPVAGANLGPPVSVTVDASDAGVVKRVDLLVNGVAYASDLVAPFAFTWMPGPGTYRLVARAVDGAGLEGHSAPVDVTVGDVNPPACRISAPLDGDTVVGTVFVAAAPTDDRGVASVRFFQDGVLLGESTSAPFSIAWESGRLRNGSYVLSCRATDFSGNESLPTDPGSSVTLHALDEKAPTVAITSPTGDDPISGPTLVVAGAQDDGAVRTVELYLDDALLATLEAPPYEVAWNASTVANGTHTLKAKAYDYNDHFGESAVVTFTTSDGRSPAVSIAFPLAGATLAGSVPVRGEATDPGGALASVELLVDGVSIETLVPPDGALPFGWEFAWATDASGNGPHDLTVRALDVAGNASLASASVVVDNPGAALDAALQVPACDAPATRCHTGALVDGRGPSEANRPNTLGGCPDGALGDYHADESIDFVSVASVDGANLTAGREVDVTVRAWVYSRTEDQVDLFFAPDAANPRWVRLASLTPGGTGLQTLQRRYTLPNGNRQALRATIRFAPASADACAFGDYDDADDLVFAVEPAADAVPPTVSITAPADGADVSGVVTIAVAASDDVGLSHVELYRDGTLVGIASSEPYAVEWDTAGLAPGAYVLTARAVDYAGNATTSAPVTVTLLDTTKPTAALTAPLDREAVLGTITLAADAADDVAVDHVEFFVGGKKVGTATAAPWQVAWNTAGAGGDGTYSVTATAWDAAGNHGDSAAVTILVSNSGNATRDRGLAVPACAAPATKCFSAALLTGRGPLGPEENAPNTLRGACGDGTQGSFHLDESVDAITIRSASGTLAAGGQAIVEVKVWAGRTFTADALDVYSAADATAASPDWQLVGTLRPTRAGPQVLWTTYTLPPGVKQAVRAQLRYGGEASFVCGPGTFDDRDDLVFAVSP